MNTSWIKNSLLAGGLILPALAISQVEVDTTLVPVKHIEMVRIPAEIVIYRMPILDQLTKDDIEQLNTDDVAGLVAKTPGATIRSYGGLGGLKTVSMRGLGGQHTAVIIDNFLVTNAQAGQLNLGQLQSEGLTSVKSGVLQNAMGLTPVSSNFTGNYLEFKSFMNTRAPEKTRVNTSVRYGSFLRREVYAQGSRGKGPWSFGAFGKYRDANGAYPYQYLNGLTTESAVRGNNDYQDMHFGGTISRSVEGADGRGNLRLIYRTSIIDQGLPGAVVFYNESADERMSTSDHRVMVDYTHHKFNFNSRYRLYLNGGINDLEYFDPTYLNAEGFIRDGFQNYSINGGYVHVREWRPNKEDYDYSKYYFIKWGAEQKVEMLESTRESLGQPLRASTFGLLAGRMQRNRIIVDATAGVQFVVDDNGETENNHIQFTPNVRALYELKSSNKMKLELIYKRNFRLPSFNELYFGEVGNSNLQPEIAHQVDLGYHWKIYERYIGWHWELKAQGFYNNVRNKIVAIPTKNLFVWSMQNVDRAMVYGGLMESRAIRRFNDSHRIEFMANYTWQRVIDITPDAITYGHQVAYAPEHTINGDVMYCYKGYSFRVSNNFVSGRYALNQNVPANYLDPFWTMDVAAGYKHTIKNRHKIGVQFNVRNLTNVSYAFIRSYVMPGRHYLLTLNYEIF